MKCLRPLLLLLVTLLPFGAHAAEGLKVELLFGIGQPAVSYNLSESETRQFWLRWRELPRSTNMVPLGNESGYRGIRIRPDDDREIRIFNGIATLDTNARVDDMRVLERWLLSKAPANVSDPVIAGLDKQVDQADSTRAAPKRDKATAQTMIRVCRERAENNKRLRARCLADSLLENYEPDEVITLLQETMLGSIKPPADPNAAPASTPPALNNPFPPLNRQVPTEGKMIRMPQEGETVEGGGKVIMMPKEFTGE